MLTSISIRAPISSENKKLPVGSTVIAGQSMNEKYSNDKKHYSKVETSADRGSDLVVTEKDSAAGRPQRVSIAVFLDRKLADEIPLIRSLVESAGGVDYGRGDRVSVQPIALASTAGPAPGRPGSATRTVLASFLPILPPTIVVLALAGLALLLLRPLNTMLGSLSFGKQPAMAAAAEPDRAATLLTHLSPQAVFRALADEPPAHGGHRHRRAFDTRCRSSCWICTHPKSGVKSSAG